MKIINTDVLVIGAGLAGATAAISSAKNGAKTTLVSALKIFSGSSFFPGTWGFGLIAPKDQNDIEDLCNTIQEVGSNISDPKLTHILASGIHKAIKQLESYDIKLLRPEDENQLEFIPCFDYKNRDWYGIIQADAKKALGEQLEKNNIECIENTSIIELICENGKIVGAVGVKNDEIILFSTKSTIIASGGMGGLFKHSLNTNDVCGIGQYLAIKSGAEVINMEFYQMMLGFIKPAYGTIFNEKVYRYSEFYDAKTGENIFENLENKEEVFETRSMHGPFTSRLKSYIVDEKIYKNYLENEEAVILKYNPSIYESKAQFVQTYFQWLKDVKGIDKKDTVTVAPFFHACNGGIKIDEFCKTNIDGLFACGEVTGGMHGADRIGGLSTANALVFGEIAGENAAKLSLTNKNEELNIPKIFVVENSEKYLSQIREINYSSLMITKTQKGLENALEKIEEIEKNLQFSENSQDFAKIKSTYQLLAAITVSKNIINQAVKRKDSKGSYFFV